jgi:hypothetical protein
MTRQERLAGVMAMRRHHEQLFEAHRRAYYNGTVEELREAKDAFNAHTEEHRKAVEQRREAQKERVK